jgi:hypothetical protein
VARQREPETGDSRALEEISARSVPLAVRPCRGLSVPTCAESHSDPNDWSTAPVSSRDSSRYSARSPGICSKGELIGFGGGHRLRPGATACSADGVAGPWHRVCLWSAKIGSLAADAASACVVRGGSPESSRSPSRGAFAVRRQVGGQRRFVHGCSTRSDSARSDLPGSDVEGRRTANPIAGHAAHVRFAPPGAARPSPDLHGDPRLLATVDDDGLVQPRHAHRTQRRS